MTQFVVEESCLFTAIASSLRNSIYSNSFSLQKCRLRVRYLKFKFELIYRFYLQTEPQISKVNNNNNCHLKFKFTDYFNNCSKNPFVKSLSRCLKITEKVSFNIVSEAKVIENAKIGQFRRVFENLKLAVKQCYQTGQF